MIDFGVVDTHVHLWDIANISYPWLADIPLLNRNYLPADYKDAHGEVPVEKMVFLECDAAPGYEVAEARWVASLVEEEPRLAGLVPSAPLESGAAAADVLGELAQIPQVKGVRRLIQSRPIGFCVQPRFIEGVRLLERYDFSFDICINHLQLANAIEMVRQCPNVSFILDHIGKPDIKEGLYEPWKTELRELSRMSNVYCKVSGMVTESDTESWKREDLKPYIDHVIESFGPSRVVFGGDWPVVLRAAQYTEWVAALEWAVSGATQTDLRKLFRDNAISFYRLG